MNKEQLTAKLKQYPVAIIGISVAILLAAFGYLRISKLPVLENEVRILSERQEAILNNDVRSTDLVEHVEKLQVQIKDLSERLLSRQDKLGNYQPFYQLAKDTGVTISQLNQDETSGPAPGGDFRPKLTLFAPVQFTMTAVGPYTGILDFLYGLQTGKQFVYVDKYTLQASAKPEEANSIVLAVTIQCLGKLQ